MRPITEEGFQTLLKKCQNFKGELGPEEFFLAGLIASQDYTIITSIFKKVQRKKEEGKVLELN